MFVIFRSRKSKTNVSLLPRALAKKQQPSSEGPGKVNEKETRQEPAKKSNEDFRKLLFKSSE